MNSSTLTSCNKTISFSELSKEFDNSLTIIDIPDFTVLDRERELRDLSYIMERPSSPVCVVLGEAGTGKSALVKTWVKLQTDAKHDYLLISFKIGILASDVSRLKTKLTKLLKRLGDYQEQLRKKNPNKSVVLFIDEVHTIVSIFEGTKIGGDLIKEDLESPPIRVIGATTFEEYDQYISSDKALSRRFKPLTLSTISDDTLLKILRQRVENKGDKDKKVAKKLADTISDDVLNFIIKTNKMYREESKEPARSIDTIETLIGIHNVDKKPIDKELVKYVFKTQYQVEIDFSTNVNNVFSCLQKRVKGQPLALYTVKNALMRMSMSLELKNKPKLSLLLTGSTGVGKTELAKALAEGIYGDESRLVILNCPDFSNEDDEPLLRKTLGSLVKHNPNCIVLCDELDKAHKQCQLSFLSVLDEGRLTYHDTNVDGYMTTNTVSFKNSIVVMTTNAGAELFKVQNQYSNTNQTITQENNNEYTVALKSEWRKLEPDLKLALQGSDLKPELIARFQNIIPFKSLTEPTLLEIAKNHIDKQKKLMKELYNLDIRLKKPIDWKSYGYNYTANEICMYFVFERVNSDDSNSGGARSLIYAIDDEFVTSVAIAKYKYPTIDKFVARLNGKAQFQDNSRSFGEGEIEVVPYNFRNDSEL